MLLDYHANTNYSVVDAGLIEELYRRHYRERVAGHERLRFLNASRVADVVETDGAVELAVESLLDGRREVLTSDAVVFATGYRPTDPRTVLGGLADRFRTDAAGRLEVTRDYRLVTDDGVTAGVYVQGPTEHTHGLTSTLLSTTAIRSAEIVAAVVAGRRAPAPAAP
jgi:L-ornithine N5-monooxygenase